MIQYRNKIRELMISVNVIDGIYEMIAKKIGIKENTLALLYALDDGKSHSQKEICEEWLIPRTTLNTIVKECVESGYVFLDTDHRKKEKEVCLTEKGQKYASDVLHQVYALEETAMKQTLEKVSAEFIDELELFTSNLKNAVGDFQNAK